MDVRRLDQPSLDALYLRLYVKRFHENRNMLSGRISAVYSRLALEANRRIAARFQNTSAPAVKWGQPNAVEVNHGI